MGILNVTPDSFSDGGSFLDHSAACAHALKLVEQGADIIDVGGESTRPGAEKVSEDEEMARVIPVIRELSSRATIPISIDTSKAAVAQAALEAGAAAVNDVSALSMDSEMAGAVARSGAGLVLMHMRGTPETMRTRCNYSCVPTEVAAELSRSLEAALAAGVDPGQVVVDPGIGFAKTVEQNLLLLRHLDVLHELGRPILIGPSRKSFIGAVTLAPVDRRLPGTLAAVVAGVLKGARIVRVHDVAETVQAVRLVDAMLDAGKPEDRAFT